MKLRKLSLCAAVLAALLSPLADAQILRPIDPNQKADIGDKSVKPGDAQLNTVTRPTLNLPNAELSKGTLKLQNADTKNVTGQKTLDYADVEIHVLPQANFTAKRIATKSSEANDKKLDDAKKKAPITDRQIRPFTPSGEEEMKKQLNEPH